MMMKISLERLLVESSKLQDHRQQSCIIRNITVESVGSSGHRMKMNVDRNKRSSQYNEDVVQVQSITETQYTIQH